jgi:hypothetical protein
VFEKIKEHLVESEWTYWEHLRHSFVQSNRLLVVALKSYIHGIFPSVFKADSPKTIIRIYHEIMRIHHLRKMKQQMEADKEI